MIRMKTPLAILLFLGLLGAAAETAIASDPTRTVRVSTEGIDARGRRVVNRIQIAPDRSVTLEASEAGGNCPSTGGLFAGKIDEEKARAIHALAEKAAREQKSVARDEEQGRGILTQLTVETGGVVRSVPVLEASKAWDDLAAALLPVRQGLRARSAVELSIRSAAPDRATVVFKHLGDEPFLLILPENAADAFSAEGARVSYAGKPPAGEHALSSRRPELAVELKLSGAREAPARIEYSNSGYRHHAANDRMSGKPFPRDVSLCARPK